MIAPGRLPGDHTPIMSRQRIMCLLGVLGWERGVDIYLTLRIS